MDCPSNDYAHIGGECRSPAAARHRSLYKCSTPPWKDAYRKRCHDRLVSNREAVILRFRQQTDAVQFSKDNDRDDIMDDCCDQGSRSAVKDLVMDEWKIFLKEMGNYSEGADNLNDGSTDVNDLLSIFEQITDELLLEEKQIIADYEARNNLVEADLNSYLESQAAIGQDFVICPVCSKAPLFLNNSIVFCSCGLRIDTEQDAITLNMIKENLAECTNQHSSICNHRPTFSVVNNFGFISNLLMTCETAGREQKYAKTRWRAKKLTNCCHRCICKLRSFIAVHLR